MKNRGLIYVLLLAALAAGFLFSLGVGALPLPVMRTFGEIFHGRSSEFSVVLLEIRLPRALLAVMVGASLGLAGACMQGFLRNPLAEPGLLGVNGGAVLGAVLCFYTGLYARFPLALPLGGLAGSLLSVAVLFLLAGSLNGTLALILAGVALNALAYALTALFLNLSSNPYAALEIVFWQMGSLADRSLKHVALAAPFMIAGWALLVWDRRSLNALTLGEETAQSLGVSLGRTSLRLVLGTALCVGASVSICGSIGFLGLVVPHLCRPFTGHEPGRVLVPSALAGAMLLLLADIAVRVIPSGTELKLGVVTSLVGVPFFLALIFKTRRELS